MDHRVKKVLGFLFLKGAMTSRNLTSLGLVALFFGVYVASGGKIAALPNLEASGNFGGIKNPVAVQDTDSPDVVDDEVVPPTKGIFTKGPEQLKPVNPLKDQLEETEETKDLDQEDPDNQDERLNSLLNRLEGMEPK